MAKFYYGGQAVIEGVMMRGQRHMAVAVRAPDGSIVVHEEKLGRVLQSPAMKLPFLRGLVGLWDALGLGTRALMFSANVAMEEEEEKPAESGEDISVSQEAVGAAATGALPFTPVVAHGQNGATSTAAATRERAAEAGREAFGGPAMWGSLAVALGVMVAIFFVLPVFIAGLVSGLAGTESSLFHNLVEGAIRLALFVGYIWLIGRMPDIKRVFGYHGAEHKTINAYEAGEELTPERVQQFTLLNPRCGTTFLLIVLVFATAVFVLLGKPPFILMVLSRIVLVPLIAAVAYEFIRLMANLYGNAIIRALLAPGLALQKMTTRPPDLSMIEVAIVALKAVLVADGVLAAEQDAGREPQAAEEAVVTLA